MSLKTGSLLWVSFETIQNHRFKTLQNQEVWGCAQPWTSAWLSQPPCKRGTPHCTSRGSRGKSAGPAPEASDQGLVPLKILRAFWPIWGPASFGSSEHFMYLRLLLLPPLWGRCCSSQIPRWGDYMPEEAWFFPLLCVFTKKETT